MGDRSDKSVAHPASLTFAGFVSGRVYGVAVTTVMFVDETTGGGRTGEWGMEVADERVTLRELIRRRIDQEVAEFNAAGRPYSTAWCSHRRQSGRRMGTG
jgi:hypothetical protein